MTNTPERPPFLPHLLIIVPIVLAISLASVAWAVRLGDSQRIQAIWTLVALLIGSGATILMRHFELHKAITELTRSVRDARESSENIVKQHERMMRIEKALHEDQQFERLAKLNEVIGQIHQARLTHPSLNDLIRWRTDRLFEAAIQNHAELSDGLIVIDDEYKELNTNEALLRTLASHEIKAVSFEDEEFWNSPEGSEFLSAHADVIRSRKVRIRRLFVLKQPVENYTSTLSGQVEVGVEVKTISQEKASRVKLEDFVLYDDHFMRKGYRSPDAPPNDGIRKFASVTWERRRLEPYIDAFDSLWKQGVPFTGTKP